MIFIIIIIIVIILSIFIFPRLSMPIAYHYHYPAIMVPWWCELWALLIWHVSNNHCSPIIDDKNYDKSAWKVDKPFKSFNDQSLSHHLIIWIIFNININPVGGFNPSEKIISWDDYSRYMFQTTKHLISTIQKSNSIPYSRRVETASHWKSVRYPCSNEMLDATKKGICSRPK